MASNSVFLQAYVHLEYKTLHWAIFVHIADAMLTGADQVLVVLFFASVGGKRLLTSVSRIYCTADDKDERKRMHFSRSRVSSPMWETGVGGDFRFKGKERFC